MKLGMLCGSQRGANHLLWVACAAALMLALAGAAHASQAMPAHGVIGVEDRHLSADYWVSRQSQPNQPLLADAAIAAQNTLMQATDKHVYALEALPAQLESEKVLHWLAALSSPPTRTLYDVQDRELSSARVKRIVAKLPPQVSAE